MRVVTVWVFEFLSQTYWHHIFFSTQFFYCAFFSFNFFHKNFPSQKKAEKKPLQKKHFQHKVVIITKFLSSQNFFITKLVCITIFLNLNFTIIKKCSSPRNVLPTFLYPKKCSSQKNFMYKFLNIKTKFLSQKGVRLTDRPTDQQTNQQLDF